MVNDRADEVIGALPGSDYDGVCVMDSDFRGRCSMCQF